MRVPGLAAALLLLACSSHGAKVVPEPWPPGGLKAKDVPQFVLFTHDDDVSKYSSGLVLPISSSARNPNGCKLPVPWFACTGAGACDFECDQAAGLYRMGHEIAVHTVNHLDLRTLPKKKIKKEILGARDAIIACGIPAAAVNGFRTPFLSDKKEVRAVLAENGFRYDSTIGAKGGANRVWPGVMSNGVGFDCSVAGQQCAASERYPNLWQVPLYEAPDENLMDYCTDEATGKPRPSCSALRQLQYMFDTAYKGNRGPVSVGVHSPYLTKSSYSKDLKKFFKYALGQQKKDVWAVTMNQLLDWMENPVPASRMSKFMKKYKCVE